MPSPSPYRSLPSSRRQALVTHDITASCDSRDTYIRALVTRGGGFRPEKLRKWPVDQLSREVVRYNLETPHDELRLLVILYVELEPEMQVTFLDALGVSHNNGSIPDDLETPFADAARVRSAAEALIASYGDEARRYLRTIALYNDAAWPGLAEMINGQHLVIARPDPAAPSASSP
jgi:hypothetical protein